MGTVVTMAWKEFKSFLFSPLAYVFLVIFLLVLEGRYFGALSTGGFTGLQIKEASLEGLFANLPFAFVVLAPALAMKLWPDELKSGTIELLMSYPVRPGHVVLGKFIAGVALIALALACTLITPFTVREYAVNKEALDWGPIIGSYAAGLLMGSAFLAVGMFAGVLCREQVTAFIIALVVCGGLVFLGDRGVMLQLPDWGAEAARLVSFQTRFESMARGVFDLRDLAYFGTFGGLFLILNVVVLECRKAR